ncbi:sushi, von Willebrand factor type A, EGF and pentraxin domain-containing protein 1-like [Ylistrum balloti]|uniref:sushi, von Willebrand factor type A, EGF and pentraxin domain-containing protein 1-like n=1 Tax=Ylistrum balloti TaxID=509963 RepID=UPI0029059630|nr:sushi, von Willebrand factor type A, EGF and pentraxin domain-containing protein 1-like [Ylistrum balloti]
MLLIFIGLLCLSGTHGSFSDIQLRAKSFCSLATFNDVEDVVCENDGVLIETDLVPSGAHCVITRNNVDQNLKCKTGIWYNVDAYEGRRRRRRRYRAPTPNKPPTVTCPTVNSQYFTDARTKKQVVTWNSATATDVDDTLITITQAHGLKSGSEFSEGYHSFGYTARDRHGNADTCSTQFEIKVRRCISMPPIPENGKMSCEPSWYDPLLGSTCTCNCNAGYSLSGSSTRTCQNTETFDGTPAVCSNFRAPSFTECISSPIKVYTERGQTSAIVSWPSLNATDNSGNATIVQTLGAASGSEFAVGSHSVSYVARDANGNQSPSCSFTVVVEQLECDPPHGIFDDELLQVDCPGSEYKYGIECSISCIRNYTIIGNTTLTCEREGTTSGTLWDWGGGAQPECDDKCPELTPPINGALVCQTAANYYCRQSCNADSGYPRGVSPGQLFICTNTQVWDPVAVDDCTGRKVPSSNVISGEMHYFVGDCSDTTVQEGLKINFITVLEDLIATGWNDVCSSSGCSVDDVTVTCGALSRKKRTTAHNGMQFVASVQSRYARSTSVITIEFSVTFPWQNGTTDYNDNLLYGVIDALEEEAGKTGSRLDYEGLTPSHDIVADPYPMISCGLGENPSYVGGEANCEGCATGKYFDSTVDDCVVCPIGTYQDESHQTTCKPCPSDMSTKETRRKNITDCFQVCNAGTYSNNGVIPCTSCAIGTYQSAKHSTECQQCDVALTTVNRGAQSSSECIGFDLILGSTGGKVTLPRLTSSLNAFSMMFWLKCPFGNITRPAIHFVDNVPNVDVFQITDSHMLEVFGSSYSVAFDTWTHVTMRWEETAGIVDLLINGVNKASVTFTENTVTAGTSIEITSHNGYNADCRLSGFWMTDTKRADAELQDDLITCTSDSTASAIYNMDDIKRQNGVLLDIPSKCDAVDECASNPCGVHECENLLNSYACSCVGGYTGSNCDTPPDFCLDNACENGAVCLNQAWNYTCQCLGDFKGELCEELIVHGQWAEWGDWTPCNATCNVGQQTRIRTCSNPPPGPDGNNCTGNDQEIQACNTEQCPSCEPIAFILLKARKVITDHCDTVDDYIRCNLTCEAGYDFSNQPLDYYECGGNTSYEWNGYPPSCGRIRGGRSFNIKASVRYTDTLTCGSSTNTALMANAGNAPCVVDSTCNVTITTDTCHKRKRKSAIGTTVEMSFVFNLEKIGDLNVTAFIESNIISSELQAYLAILEDYEDTDDLINSTSEAFFNVIINGNTYTIDPDTLVIDSHTACENGSVDFDGGCVECPVGTRQDGVWCVFCDFGTYQNESGQSVCKQCPTGYTTEFVGMIEEENCSITVVTTTSAISTTSTTSSVASAVTSTTTTTTPITTTAPSTTTTTTPITTTTTPTTISTTPATVTTSPETTTSTLMSSKQTSTTPSEKTSVTRDRAPNLNYSHTEESLSLPVVAIIGSLIAVLVLIIVALTGIFMYRHRLSVRAQPPETRQIQDIHLNIRMHSNIPNTTSDVDQGLPPHYLARPLPSIEKGGLPSAPICITPTPYKSDF